MAHGIKKLMLDKSDELECNNNQQCASNINKMALSSLLLDNCCRSPANQTLMNQKNSSTNTSALVATHQLLPPTQSTSGLMNNSNGNKLSLNCSGASVSTIASSNSPTAGTKMGSRRIFTPQFKLQVLESYRNDNDCKGNQRATARKYGIHRRQIQKWLQCENNLRSIIANISPHNAKSSAMKATPKATAPILSSSSNSRHRGVVGANTDKGNGATYSCFTLSNAKSYKSSSPSTTTKSLSSSSLAFNDYSMCSSATAIETNRNFFSSRLMTAATRFVKGEELPIDLSCGNKIKLENVARPIAIHPSPFYRFNASPASASPPHQLTDISNSVVVKQEPRINDPIDLSVPNVSHKRRLSSDNGEKADKKPVKLFRPYLEGNFDGEQKDQKHDDMQKFPIVWSNAFSFYPDHFAQPDFHPANHPFLVGSPPFFDSTPSPNDSGIMSTSFQTLMPPSQASPVSGYDSSTSSIYDDGDQGNSPLYTSSHYDAPSPISATMSPTETKVPLYPPSYLHDLKFKLHALDCFYNDAECKRNEKLVANKLNINSKIVEKWLRQETDLRHQQKQYHLEILV
jgi:transposase-like protein